tara:strand:+ start:973 stop:1629 length:657 start_codon:yes stop_codon:yes gene_type:complete
MIILCGFAASNYYNKVKLVLLEKKIEFKEKLVWTDRSSVLLKKSPLGKIPYFEIGNEILCESQVMVDYLESTFTKFPLLPFDSLIAAKIRHLIFFMEIYLELVIRELYSEAFFGEKVDENYKLKIKNKLIKNLTIFNKYVKYSPYIFGEKFTMADCAAAVHLPVIRLAIKKVFKNDFFDTSALDNYLNFINERHSVKKVIKDRKLNANKLKKRKAHYY